MALLQRKQLHCLEYLPLDTDFRFELSKVLHYVVGFWAVVFERLAVSAYDNRAVFSAVCENAYMIVTSSLKVLVNLELLVMMVFYICELNGSPVVYTSTSVVIVC